MKKAHRRLKTYSENCLKKAQFGFLCLNSYLLRQKQDDFVAKHYIKNDVYFLFDLMSVCFSIEFFFIYYSTFLSQHKLTNNEQFCSSLFHTLQYREILEESQ